MARYITKKENGGTPNAVLTCNYKDNNVPAFYLFSWFIRAAGDGFLLTVNSGCFFLSYFLCYILIEMKYLRTYSTNGDDKVLRECQALLKFSKKPLNLNVRIADTKINISITASQPIASSECWRILRHNPNAVFYLLRTPEIIKFWFPRIKSVGTFFTWSSSYVKNPISIKSPQIKQNVVNEKNDAFPRRRATRKLFWLEWHSRQKWPQKMAAATFLNLSTGRAFCRAFRAAFEILIPSFFGYADW